MTETSYRTKRSSGLAPEARRIPGSAWRRSLAALLLPLLLTAGVPAAAEEQSGRTITAVEWKGLATLSQETMLYYLGLEVGKPFDEAALDRNIKQLWERRLIDDVSVEAEPSGEGVKLTITVVERPVLRSIDFQGLKRVSKTDVQDKIATQRIQVREGDPVSLGELQRVKTLIEELYKEKGYRFAQARYTIDDLGPNEKRVVFSVDEGNRVRIADLSFEGNTVFADARLRLAMKKTKETSFVSRLSKHDIYNPATLQEDLDKVRDLYRGAGYKNVVLGEPKVEVKAEHPDAVLARQNRRMYITIPVDEGERWKFGEVTLDGNKVYTQTGLLRLFRHSPNSWLKAKVLDDGVKAITDIYHNSGYIFARVEPEIVEKSGNVADVLVHITEGDQFRVGRIEFDGNEKTRDRVLRRELRLQEGSVVSIAGVKNTVTKVNQLGFFKLNEEDPVDIDYDSAGKKVNLVFKGTEAERTELQFGGGWSEVDQFFGQFSINTKNFLGRGEQLGFSFQSGGTRDVFDLSYFVPWLADKPQSLGVRVFNQNLDYNVVTDQRLVTKSKGVALTYGRSFGLFQQVSLTYSLGKEDDTQSFLNAMGLPQAVHLKVANSSIRPNFLYDSRDNPFEPLRGTKLSLGVEYAGGPLGGDNHFLRPEVGFSFFRPISSGTVRTVFAANVEAGLIHNLENFPVAFNILYRLGGDNSVRGFPFGTILARGKDGGALVSSDLIVLGGDRYFQGNLEYQVLLGGPFRVLGFLDAGNVWNSDFGAPVDFHSLRMTTGLELRVLLPVFGAPLRFIYAYNLDKKPDDRFQRFQFSIGTSF
ncbi:MAG TPA: outer membrane protein assembly factor BamA [Thermoanaerobaculia bacterium]|nr:outer membrane protein assembly factor BamA [Thermoanaerobaculia bacterium]